MNSPMLTLDEVCRILRISKATGYRQVKKGNIPGSFQLQRGSGYRINAEQFETWMRGESKHAD